MARMPRRIPGEVPKDKTTARVENPIIPTGTLSRRSALLAVTIQGHWDLDAAEKIKHRRATLLVPGRGRGMRRSIFDLVLILTERMGTKICKDR
jgi:hypothetical protein